MNDNLEAFLGAYRDELVRSIATNPEEYTVDADTIFNRMRAAIIAGTFNKDSASFRRTCKRLGIKHTYASIKGYIQGGST